MKNIKVQHIVQQKCNNFKRGRYVALCETN